MKKILFIIPHFRIGGTLTSLTNLLPLLDRNKYNIEIFALSNIGDGLIEISKYATIIGISKTNNSNIHTHNSIKSKVIICLKKIKNLILFFGIDLSPLIFKKMAKSLSNRGYDIVIAYQEGQTTRMAQYIQAPIKIAWIHSIYSRFIRIKGNSHFRESYFYYNKIVCVSKTAAKDFIHEEPDFESKVHIIYNAINKERIVSLSKEIISLGNNFNIVSVGRIAEVKRFSFIPEIASNIINKGINIDWWIVGDSVDKNEYNLLCENIKKYNVSNIIHLVGAKYNPYPYIVNSDILVCLSSSETYNYTLAEAKALSVPIVTTDFDSAFEFIDNGNTGLISSIKSISNCIYSLLSDAEMRKSIKNNLMKYNSNSIEFRNEIDSLLS